MEVSIKKRIRYSKAFEFFSIILKTKYGMMLSNDEAFFGKLFYNYGINTVFDIGANDGVKTRTFLKLGKKVISVEPDPSLASIIRYRNLKRNDKMAIVEELAVGSENGEAEFETKVFSGYNTLSKKWSEHTLDQGIFTIKKIPVKLVVIEELISKHGLPDYIKIDVEGLELDVFKGLNQKIRIISFEANLPLFLQETMEIVQKIKNLCENPSFNYRIGANNGFALPKHLDSDSILAELENLGNTSVDVFVFM
jgi:FkbM family methyltransferase